MPKKKSDTMKRLLSAAEQTERDAAAKAAILSERNSRSSRIRWSRIDPQERSRIASEIATARWAKLTPAERSEAARHAAQAKRPNRRKKAKPKPKSRRPAA